MGYPRQSSSFLSEEHDAFRDTVAAFVEREIRPHADDREAAAGGLHHPRGAHWRTRAKGHLAGRVPRASDTGELFFDSRSLVSTATSTHSPPTQSSSTSRENS